MLVGKQRAVERHGGGGSEEITSQPPVGPGTPLLRAAAEEIFALVQE